MAENGFQILNLKSTPQNTKKTKKYYFLTFSILAASGVPF